MIKTRTWIFFLILCVAPVRSANSEHLTNVVAGDMHTCAINSSGRALCWGEDSFGQLGNGETNPSATGVIVANLDIEIRLISAGHSHTCAITKLGAATCWGYNFYNQLGNGSGLDSYIPVSVVGLKYGVTAISAGFSHSCAITESEGVFCWGDNTFGQLGDGTIEERSRPIKVLGLSSGVSAIAAGEYHSCAITFNGITKCWGRNNVGQLGDGTRVDRSSPVGVLGLGEGAKAISSRSRHNCAIAASGAVKCWGKNDSGQLGDKTTVDKYQAVDVIGMTSTAIAIAAGSAHTCLITEQGNAQCWGNNQSGQLGDSTTEFSSSPVNVSNLPTRLIGITAGGAFTCATTASLDTFCWGENSSGQLGDGTTTNLYIPGDIEGLTTGVDSFSGKEAHLCAVMETGEAKCAGFNWAGGLGDGTTINRHNAVYVLGLNASVRNISVGSGHSCALTLSGHAKCWGCNSNGQLGDNTTIDRLTAVPVFANIMPSLSFDYRNISTGGSHTCAVTTSNVAKCWGGNRYGQLGTGDTNDSHVPRDVMGLTNGVIAIEAGDRHSCAITVSGAAKCWGFNSNGQLGDGSTTERLTPVDVLGLSSGVTSIAPGSYHTCAVTSSGGAKCWGENAAGELGNGSVIDSYHPVDVLPLSSGVQSISVGNYHTCALTLAGGVKCWGANDSGQLGDGTALTRSTAVDVFGLTSNVKAISTGYFQSCALTFANSIKCWGSHINMLMSHVDPTKRVVHTKRRVLQGKKINGVVMLGNRPLPGVLLRLSNMGPLYASLEAISDGEGRYTLPIVESLYFSLTPELAGHTFSPANFTGKISDNLFQNFLAERSNSTCSN